MDYNVLLNTLKEGIQNGIIENETVRAFYDQAVATERIVDARQVFRELQACFPNDREIRSLNIALCLKQQDYSCAMENVETMIATCTPDDGLIEAGLSVRSEIGPISITCTENFQETISLCMIAKNEVAGIGACLNVVKPLVDEIIVVDTGSTDRTRDVAKIFGARTFDFQWCDDFSAARNFSLNQARGNWILILDADEMIAPSDHAAIKALIGKYEKSLTAFSMETRNYTNVINTIGWNPNKGEYPQIEAGLGWFSSRKVRLFNNKKDIKFCHPVHEQVEKALIKEKVPIVDCLIPVHHYGDLNEFKKHEKSKLYFQLGFSKLDQLGDDFQSLRELACQAGQIGLWDESINLWKRLLKLHPDYDEAYVNISNAYWQLGKYKKAIAFAKRSSKINPNLKEAYFNEAVSFLLLGKPFESLLILQKLVKNYNSYLSARLMLAVALACTGDMNQCQDIMHKLFRHINSKVIQVALREIAERFRICDLNKFSHILQQLAVNMEKNLNNIQLGKMEISQHLNKKQSLRIVIYTCCTGSYDKIEEINTAYPNIDFVCFTDNHSSTSKSWDVQYIKPLGTSNRDRIKTARYYKIFPHLLFPKHNISVWIDANMFSVNIENILMKCVELMQSPYDMAITDHSERNCIYDEGSACIMCKKDDPKIIKAQLEKYQKEGMPKQNGLVETTMIFRKHDSPALKKVSEAWWNEINSYSIRDQLSFNYVSWKYNYSNYTMFSRNERNTKYSKFRGHLKNYINSHLKQILIAGPWLGEFGWELMAWQAIVRHYAHTYAFDKICVACKSGHEALYSDYADEFITLDMPGETQGPLLKGQQVIFNFIKVLPESKKENTVLLYPSIDLCHTVAVSQTPSVYIRFGNKNLLDAYDVLLHIRSCSHAGSEFRNWAENKWKNLFSRLSGLRVGCVGRKNQAGCLEGAEDLRDLPLYKLMDICASSGVIIGPSSGVMHLASLCGCPQIVWTDKKPNLLGHYTNKQRYEKIWNPFKSSVQVIDEYEWNPPVGKVFDSMIAFRKAIESERISNYAIA